MWANRSRLASRRPRLMYPDHGSGRLPQHLRRQPAGPRQRAAHQARVDRRTAGLVGIARHRHVERPPVRRARADSRKSHRAADRLPAGQAGRRTGGRDRTAAVHGPLEGDRGLRRRPGGRGRPGRGPAAGLWQVRGLARRGAEAAAYRRGHRRHRQADVRMAPPSPALRRLRPAQRGPGRRLEAQVPVLRGRALPAHRPGGDHAALRGRALHAGPPGHVAPGDVLRPGRLPGARRIHRGGLRPRALRRGRPARPQGPLPLHPALALPVLADDRPDRRGGGRRRHARPDRALRGPLVHPRRGPRPHRRQARRRRRAQQARHRPPVDQGLGGRISPP